MAAVIVLTFLLHQPGRAAAAGVPPLRVYDETIEAPGLAPVRLHAEEMGQGDPILLVHGLGGSTYTWRHIAPALARDHRVIALDLKGFGRSEKPFDLAYSAIDQALLVAGFVERRGLKGLTLVGHSFGGAVALIATLEINRRSPGRIRRLVLMDAPAFPQAFSTMVRFFRVPVIPYLAMTLMPPEVAVRKAIGLGRLGMRPYTDSDVAHYAEPLGEAGARHAMIATAREIVPERWDRIIARYGTIRQPTLILWCRDDPIVPISSGVRLRQALPAARMRTIEGCEHVPPDESPDTVLFEVRRFLAYRSPKQS